MDTQPQTARTGDGGMNAFYERHDTPEKRTERFQKGHSDARAGLPKAEPTDAEKASGNLRKAYEEGYRLGKFETTPPPPPKIEPSRDYAVGIAFMDPDVEKPPIGIPILIRQYGGAHVAMAVVERDSPDEYRLLEGFEGSDWRHYESDAVDGWAHVFKPGAHRGNLPERRAAAAESAYGDYDFGGIVLSSDGWESTVPSDETTRRLVVETDEDGSIGTMQAHFTVRFHPNSAEIAEAYAITQTGNIFGKPEED